MARKTKVSRKALMGVVVAALIVFILVSVAYTAGWFESLLPTMPQSQTAAVGATITKSPADIVVTPVSATIATKYNPDRPSTPFLVATHTIKLKSNKNIIIYCSVTEFSSPSVPATGFNSQKVGCSVKGMPTTTSAYNLLANKEYEYIVSSTVDTNEMIQGVYKSIYKSFAYEYVMGESGYIQMVNDSITPTIAVVGETGPYLVDVTRNGDTILITGQRFDPTVTVTVGSQTFKASSQLITGNQYRISFSQKGIGIPAGSQPIFVVGTKGKSNTRYYDFPAVPLVYDLKIITPSGAGREGVCKPTYCDVIFSVTLENRGNSGVYISKNPAIALATTTSPFATGTKITSVTATTIGESGDTSTAYLIGGKTRTFTYKGVIAKPATGSPVSQTFKITKINYGPTATDTTKYGITSGLLWAKVMATL